MPPEIKDAPAPRRHPSMRESIGRSLRLLAALVRGTRRSVRAAFAVLSGSVAAAAFLVALVLAPLPSERGWLAAAVVATLITILGGCLFNRVLARTLDRLEAGMATRTRELATSEAHLRLILEGSPDVILHLERDGTCAFVNGAWARHLGTPPPFGESFCEVVDPRDQAALRACIARVLGGDAAGDPLARVVEVRIPDREGEPRRVEVNLHRLKQAPPEVPELVAVLRDVTEQRRTLEELASYREGLLKARQLESLGNLAGGIAHEFNNLLGAILGFATHSQRIPGLNPVVDRALRMIESSAQRGAALTQRLLGLTRSGPGQREAFTPAECLEVVGSLLPHHLPDSIEARFEVEPGLPRLLGERARVEQALVNLCINARDAMPQGGRLTVRARAGSEGGRDAVLLSVSDTGHGIARELQERLFEPLFTTKTGGRGLGLGLAQVWQVARSHGGSVRVLSHVGGGTTVTLALPVMVAAPDAAPPLPPARAAASPPSAGGSAAAPVILVAEDEPAVREFVASALGAAGYRVILAEDGWRALELFDRHKDAIALVILDLVMPEVSGEQVFAKIREAAAPPRILLSSGYNEEGKAESLLALGADDFLAKPYRTQDLLAKVARLLEAVPAG